MNGASILERSRRWAFFVGLAGLALAFIIGLPEKASFIHGYLSAFALWIGVSLGCAAILMIHHLTGGGWGWSVRRQCEAAASILPLFLLFFVPILIWMRWLYPWVPGAQVGESGYSTFHSAWFTLPLWLVRTAGCFALWIVGIIYLTRWSLIEDRTGTMGLRVRLKNLAAGGLVFYGYSSTFALIDWVGSMEMHWYSSIYGMYILIEQGLAALSLMVLIVILAGGRIRIEPDVISRKRLNDLGNLLLAFIMLNAYIMFSQWLIIWNGNLPNEIAWYERRIHDGWGAVIVVIGLTQFGAPFCGLIFQRVKRSRRMLLLVATLIFLATALHALWMVLPAHPQDAARSILTAISAMIGIGGIWLAVFMTRWLRLGEPLFAVQRTGEAAHAGARGAR